MQLNTAPLTVSPASTAYLASNLPHVLSGAGGSVASSPLTSTSISISSNAHALLEADTSPPRIVGFSPSDNARNVSPKANITVTFSEKIKAGTGNIVLRDSSGNIVESFNVANSSRLKISGNRVRIDPTNNFAPYNARYTVSFEPGAITDLAGNAFSSSTTYGFSTRTDTRAPTVTRFTPSRNGKNVSLTSNISLTFSEKIMAGSGTIVIRDNSGNVFESFDVATSNRIKISGSRLKIDPTQNFAFGTSYTVSFESGAITDLAGNSFENSKAYSFTTKQERTPPKVVEFFPRDGTRGTSPLQSIYVKFSEDIKRGTGFIILRDAAGKIVERYRAQNSSNISISGNVLVIDPSIQLDTNKKYKVEFARGSIIDLAGNRYKGSKSYDFTTATSNTAPTSPSWAPSSGSGGSSSGNFNIELNYSGDSTYLTYFQQATAFWENIVIGDLPDINGVDDLRITATVEAIDGPGGTLGSAGPTLLRASNYLPYEGQMKFDSADIANMIAGGIFLRVVIHEMGHVLGIGSLWGTFGFNTTPGQYTGAKGVEAYRTMAGGNPAASFVPLEDDGGAGTANVHWEEDIFGDELMTGYAENHPNMPLSILSIAALEDLGYQVNYAAAEPYTVSA